MGLRMAWSQAAVNRLAALARDVPHAPQNLAVEGSSDPQLGQPPASRAPHSMQKRLLASLVVPQSMQRKSRPPFMVKSEA